MALDRRIPAILLLVFPVLAAVWWSGRAHVEHRLVLAAIRDLDTIVEFVSLDLERIAKGSSGSVAGVLEKELANSGSGLARTLARADETNFRRVYFFDRSGRTLGAGNQTIATPAIVREALGDESSADRHGARFKPYADAESRLVVGVWRWLDVHHVGIVAERPYDRFIQTLRWLDAVFVVIVALGVALAIFLTRPDLAALGRAFRRTDIRNCGPYRIKRLLGEGSMANVYLAEHRDLRRVVALKRLKLQAQRDETVARFEREVRLASQLAHPSIVTVYDHGRDADGALYYTMEFVRGLTLTQWVEQHGPLPPARALRLLRQICAAVGAMHARQLLHRDIKPDNIMAYAAHGDFDLVKLLDFGLIRDLENTATRDLTRDARVLGTPAFMAPERLFDPRTVDVRSDIYGIGCVAFFLLTGHRPFEAPRDGDLVQQIRHVPAPAVSSLAVFPIPAALDALIGSALAKSPEDRPPSTEAFDAELARIEPALPWHAGKARLWWGSVMPEE